MERLEGERNSGNRLESDAGDVSLLPRPKANDEEAPAALSTSDLTLLLNLPKGKGDDEAVVIMAAVDTVCLLELRNGGTVGSSIGHCRPKAISKTSDGEDDDEDARTRAAADSVLPTSG